jgi:hypothetical protein
VKKEDIGKNSNLKMKMRVRARGGNILSVVSGKKIDHIQNLKTLKIWKYLNEIDSQYATKSVNFLEKIYPLLETIQEYFPYYTRHDAIHGYNVLKKIEEIINPPCLEKDSPYGLVREEVFLLICGAYAHDLGMTILPNEENRISDSLGIKKEGDWKTNNELQNYLRKTHSERGGEYIIESPEEFSIPYHLRGLLNKIMAAHNMSENEFKELREIPVPQSKCRRTIQKLACLLCVADILEFSDTRVIEGVIEKIKGTTQEKFINSYRENMKNETIGSNIGIDAEKIQFYGCFEEPEVMNLAYKTIDDIKYWTTFYKDIDMDYGYPMLKINPYNIKAQFEGHKFKFNRFSIQIKKDNIISLIASSSMWGNNPKAVIKELLQNSIEACRYRIIRRREGESYAPKIELRYCTKTSEFTISDNGCGMDEEVIKNHFLTVGNSRSFEQEYCKNHAPLARFGIGFWSVFTISNEAEVETAPYESIKEFDNTSKIIKGFKFSASIDELKDYTVFREIRMGAGTKISLEIKEIFSKQFFALYDWVKEILVCSSIPITIYIDENKYEIPLKIVPMTLNDLIEDKEIDPCNQYKKTIEANELQLFQWGAEESKDQEINFSMGIIYRLGEEGFATFMKKDKEFPITSWGYIKSKHHFGICGFHVTPNVYIAFPGNYNRFFISNTDNPKGFKFDIQRLSLLDSPKRKNYVKQLANLELNGIRKFLTFTNSNNPKAIFHLNRQSLMPSSDYFQDYTTKEGFELYKDLICYRVYKLNRDTEKNQTSAEEHYLRIEDLLKLDGDIWFYKPSSMSGGHVMSLNYPNNYFQGTQIGHGNDANDLLIPHITRCVLDYILRTNPEKRNYLIDPNRDAAVLFENDSLVEIHTIGDYRLPLMYESNRQPIIIKDGYVQLFKINQKNVEISDEKTTKIFNYKKTNSNTQITIFENKIVSPNKKKNFIFIDHGYKLVVKKDSKLALDIKILISENKFIEINKLMQLLKSAYEGIVDESIRKYLE